MRLHTLLSLLAILTACAAPEPATPVHDDLAGYYSAGPFAVTEVRAVEDYVGVRPPHWGGRPYFAETMPGHFELALPHADADRWVEFERDDHGEVTGLRFEALHPGFDGLRFERLNGDESTPASLFLEGEPERAARTALSDPDITVDDIHTFAREYLTRYPEWTSQALRFIITARSAHPDHAGLMADEGLAQIALHNRVAAEPLLVAALGINPGDEAAAYALHMLRQSEPGEGQGYRAVLPFTLDEAFADPTPTEISAVSDDWARRDLFASNVETVHEYAAEIGGRSWQVRILRHELHGATHFGAIFLPMDHDAEFLPVVIDARGVNVSYAPMDIASGTQLLRALPRGEADFILLVPAMNGHTLIADGREFTAEGDPSDAWDGATDATLGFLNAALAVTPQADPDRIAAFGHSRGGTVAMLAGIRDPRISLVLPVAGPVDHFHAQDPAEGWTSAEILRDAMSDGRPATLDEAGGQDFDHFFHRVFGDGETLAAVRHRMIASSPLYFADRLPEIHAFYGAGDRSVPIANPRLLRAAMVRTGRLDAGSTITIFPDLSHDTDSLISWRDSVDALNRWAGHAD
jgi:hypothetical protein